MAETTEILIENVRKCKFLYDTSNEHYKNVLKKAEAWNEISKEVNLTSDAAKTKWKNLRDSYMRFKKATKGETGQATKYSKWPWSSQMSFLDATLQYRPQSSNISQATVQIEDESPSQAPTSRLEPNNVELNQLCSPPEMLPPPPPKKKIRSHSRATENISSDSEVDKVISFLQTKKSQEKNIDGIDHLFLSYAATFKTFRPRTQSILKLKLATLFSETELSELEEQHVSQATSPEQPLSQAPSPAYSSSTSSGFTTYNFLEPEETAVFSSETPLTSASAFHTARNLIENFSTNE